MGGVFFLETWPKEQQNTLLKKKLLQELVGTGVPPPPAPPFPTALMKDNISISK